MSKAIDNLLVINQEEVARLRAENSSLKLTAASLQEEELRLLRRVEEEIIDRRVGEDRLQEIIQAGFKRTIALEMLLREARESLTYVGDVGFETAQDLIKRINSVLEPQAKNTFDAVLGEKE